MTYNSYERGGIHIYGTLRVYNNFLCGIGHKRTKQMLYFFFLKMIIIFIPTNIILRRFHFVRALFYFIFFNDNKNNIIMCLNLIYKLNALTKLQL